MLVNSSKKTRQQMTRNNKSTSGKKTYRSDNYRAQYFKKNPGLFGKLHFCHYCGKPLTKKKVEVDHILPVSKSRINSTMNLVAACRKCNRSKSDKVNHLVVVGFTRKIAGNLMGLPFKIIGMLLSAFFALGTKAKFVTICLLVLGYFYISSGS